MEYLDQFLKELMMAQEELFLKDQVFCNCGTWVCKVSRLPTKCRLKNLQDKRLKSSTMTTMNFHRNDH